VSRIPFLAASGIAALVIPPAQVAIAADYMSVDAAQRAFFAQADRFDEVVLALNADQKQAVTQLAGPQPPHRSLRAWKAIHGNDVIGYVFVDEVLGRQDMITYAVAIDASGKMSPIEVLSYRESHGSEIRGTAWRHQFDGRQGLEHLRFGTDIKNIAGATLSCEHVTQGVRWVTALWQVTLRPSPASARTTRPVRNGNSLETAPADATPRVSALAAGASSRAAAPVGAATGGAVADGASLDGSRG
jgi:Na+-translocating ferredoxin:NAD+ oxidoreductase RnfG subunit